MVGGRTRSGENRRWVSCAHDDRLGAGLGWENKGAGASNSQTSRVVRQDLPTPPAPRTVIRHEESSDMVVCVNVWRGSEGGRKISLVPAQVGMRSEFVCSCHLTKSCDPHPALLRLPNQWKKKTPVEPDQSSGIKGRRLASKNERSEMKVQPTRSHVSPQRGSSGLQNGASATVTPNPRHRGSLQEVCRAPLGPGCGLGSVAAGLWNDPNRPHHPAELVSGLISCPLP